MKIEIFRAGYFPIHSRVKINGLMAKLNRQNKCVVFALIITSCFSIAAATTAVEMRPYPEGELLIYFFKKKKRSYIKGINRVWFLVFDTVFVGYTRYRCRSGWLPLVRISENIGFRRTVVSTRQVHEHQLQTQLTHAERKGRILSSIHWVLATEDTISKS